EMRRVLDFNTMRSLLDGVRAGTMSVDEALSYCGSRMADEPELPYATLDHLRPERTGSAEVVYCPGKTGEQVASIVDRLARRNGVVFATRASASQYDAVRAIVADATFDADARIIAVELEAPARVGLVAVVSAGTADHPVASEAAVSLDLMGNAVSRIEDVGVAGLHRVLAHVGALRTANCIV